MVLALLVKLNSGFLSCFKISRSKNHLSQQRVDGGEGAWKDWLGGDQADENIDDDDDDDGVPFAFPSSDFMSQISQLGGSIGPPPTIPSTKKKEVVKDDGKIEIESKKMVQLCHY